MDHACPSNECTFLFGVRRMTAWEPNTMHREVLARNTSIARLPLTSKKKLMPWQSSQRPLRKGCPLQGVTSTRGGRISSWTKRRTKSTRLPSSPIIPAATAVTAVLTAVPPAGLRGLAVPPWPRKAQRPRAAVASARDLRSTPGPISPIPAMSPSPGTTWSKRQGPGTGVFGSSPIHILLMCSCSNQCPFSVRSSVGHFWSLNYNAYCGFLFLAFLQVTSIRTRWVLVINLLFLNDVAFLKYEYCIVMFWNSFSKYL